MTLSNSSYLQIVNSSGALLSMLTQSYIKSFLTSPHSVSLRLSPSDSSTLPENVAAAHQHAGGGSHRWQGKSSVLQRWTTPLVRFQSRKKNLTKKTSMLITRKSGC